MLMLVALSFYTPKKMRNINIPSGRGMILSGDRQKAATYVGIAKRKMHDMKQMMSIGKLPMMQRRLMLDRDCVWVHLLSVDGSDFIRIHSCAEGGKCKLVAIFADNPGLGINATFDLTYTFDDKSSSQIAVIDTGGRNLSGTNRYNFGSFGGTPPEVTRSGSMTFNTAGEKSLTVFAQANQNIVSYNSGFLSPTQSSLSAVVDTSSLGSKVTVHFLMDSVGNTSPIECFLNGVSVGEAFGTDYRSSIWVRGAEITDSTALDFTASGTFIQRARVFFRPFDCLVEQTHTVIVT